MASRLAPYNNSMRLGQGFNSYTQQICLDQAVLPDTPENRAIETERVNALERDGSLIIKSETANMLAAQKQESSATPDSSLVHQELQQSQGDGDVVPKETPKVPSQVSTAILKVEPWVKPQIVTYSSRFVDKLSDITDAMNISGSLSIKTATIGGKVNGSYVDSDKFKSSDINFYLQVDLKSRHDAREYNVFNKLSIHESKFTEVYGDSFISGWEEGGELNAVISVKVLDKNKIFSVKAGLEAELTTPGIGGQVKGDVAIEKSTLNKETETTIVVNWSGGGSIKDPLQDWTIDSLKRAAAAFPELVAITPQRTHAILTKYTALESFHKQQADFSPLDYENAGIYTGSLLDHYMDYKALWKQIANATFELEANRATIDIGEPTQEMSDLAWVRELPMAQKEPTHAELKRQNDATKQATLTNPAQAASVPSSNPPNGDFVMVPQGRTGQGAASSMQGSSADSEGEVVQVFNPSFAGLISARKICRREMSKIVREVDYVAKDPKLALDPARDSYFLNPLVFKQLLPIVRSLSPENAMLGVRDPAATLLLGYSPPKAEDRFLPIVYDLRKDFKDHSRKIRDSLEKVGHRARDYRIQGCAGAIAEPELHSQVVVFNDLEYLDPTWRPSAISFWSDGKKFQGVKMEYAGQKKPRENGFCTGTPTQRLQLEPDGSEAIVEIKIEEVVNKQDVVQYIKSVSVATSFLRILESTPTIAQESQTSDLGTDLFVRSTTWTRPDDTRYSVRGFFGTQYDGAICTLAVVWGKDGFVPIPSARMQQSLCKNFLGLSSQLQENLRGYLKPFAGNFITGTYIDTLPKGRQTLQSTATSTTYFNAMVELDISWRIKNVSFASVNGKLTGLKVEYAHGKVLQHGAYTPETEKWTCPVTSDLSIVKFTGGSLGDVATSTATPTSYIDTVEFVRVEPNGNLPTWPLDVATMRFLGEDDKRVSKDRVEVIEAAPTLGHDRYSVRGFFGECSAGIITRLGVIWGSL